MTLHLPHLRRRSPHRSLLVGRCSFPPARHSAFAPAFTLLELLAATALTALFSLAVLFVLANISRSSRALSPTESDPSPAILQRIGWDLANARLLRTSADGFEIGGYSALAPAGGPPTHSPVIVAYRLLDLAGHHAIVRSQRDPAGATSSELLCMDVAAFSLAKLELPPSVKLNPPSTSTATQPTSRPTVDPALLLPARVRLTLTWTDPTRPPIDRTLFIRN